MPFHAVAERCRQAPYCNRQVNMSVKETPNEASYVIRDEGPAELIRQVRAAEDDDRDCLRWPREKPLDDATIVYWHLD